VRLEAFLGWGHVSKFAIRLLHARICRSRLVQQEVHSVQIPQRLRAWVPQAPTQAGAAQGQHSQPLALAHSSGAAVTYSGSQPLHCERLLRKIELRELSASGEDRNPLSCFLHSTVGRRPGSAEDRWHDGSQQPPAPPQLPTQPPQPPASTQPPAHLGAQPNATSPKQRPRLVDVHSPPPPQDRLASIAHEVQIADRFKAWMPQAPAAASPPSPSRGWAIARAPSPLRAPSPPRDQGVSAHGASAAPSALSFLQKCDEQAGVPLPLAGLDGASNPFTWFTRAMSEAPSAVTSPMSFAGHDSSQRPVLLRRTPSSPKMCIARNNWTTSPKQKSRGSLGEGPASPRWGRMSLSSACGQPHADTPPAATSSPDHFGTRDSPAPDEAHRTVRERPSAPSSPSRFGGASPSGSPILRGRAEVAW